MAYTSARLKTQGKRTFGPYGHDARRASRIPTGQGLLAGLLDAGQQHRAAWRWPGCGEIDIMEHVNNERQRAGHDPLERQDGAYASYTATHAGRRASRASTRTRSTGTPRAIRWYLDGVDRGAANIANSINGTDEFHRPFFVILNLAVGGNWPGPPNARTVFPADYQIDCVRVATAASNPTPTPTAPPRATRDADHRAPRDADLAPGGLLSLNRPATASSVGERGHGRQLAVDGNTGTRWSSAFCDPQWITVDLGATANITARAPQLGGRLRDRVSDPGLAEQQHLDDGHDVTGGDGGIDDHNMTTSGRYVRMNGTARATAYGYSLWEFEVYGTAGSPTATPTKPPRATATALASGPPPPRPLAPRDGDRRRRPPRATPTSGGGGSAWAPA